MQQNHQNHPVYLTERQAAEAGYAKVSTLQKYRHLSRQTGQLVGPPWFKAGRAVKYSLADLEAWMASQRPVI